jgi:hypothetical protein
MPLAEAGIEARLQRLSRLARANFRTTFEPSGGAVQAAFTLPGELCATMAEIGLRRDRDMTMKIKFGASIAALAAGAALAASPALAKMHGGVFHGGGGHAAVGGFHGGGFHGAGGWGGRGWGGRGWGWGGGYWGGGWGWWGAPFFWGGLGFIGGYAVAPYGYYDSYDAYYGDPYASAPPAYGPNGGPPPGAGAPNGPPPGYDCDGWRWDAAANHYVAAKVACN